MPSWNALLFVNLGTLLQLPEPGEPEGGISPSLHLKKGVVSDEFNTFGNPLSLRRRNRFCGGGCP